MKVAGIYKFTVKAIIKNYPYSGIDFQNHLKLFNDMHREGMELILMSTEKMEKFDPRDGIERKNGKVTEKTKNTTHLGH